MGKVIRKRGFLWFGKAIEEWYCDECGKQLQDPFFQDEKVYCEPCANSIDLSIVHGWSSNEIVEKYHLEQFFRDTQDRKEKYIDQCYRCEGLAVHIKTSSGIGPRPGKVEYKYAGLTPIESLNINGSSAFATWLYTVDQLSVNIIYVTKYRHPNVMKNTFHPNKLNIILKIKEFKT